MYIRNFWPSRNIRFLYFSDSGPKLFTTNKNTKKIFEYVVTYQAKTPLYKLPKTR